MEHFLGIDIGGTNVKCGLVSSEGELLEKTKYATTELQKENSTMESLVKVIGWELEKHSNVKKVGIGIPGTLSKDRNSTIDLPNIPDLAHTNVMGTLKAAYPDIIFHMENDANAAALGEFYFSKATMPDDFIFITLGTGVGGACIMDRKIFKGGNGNGLEIGHIIAGNGKTIENNIGKKGILGMALTTLEGYKGKSVLSDMGSLNAKKVIKAAQEEDKLAMEIFHEVGKYLGEAIVSAVRLFDIHTIIIGGGVSKTFHLVEKSMYKKIYDFLSPYYTDDLRIRLASLRNEAGIIGAASLCFIED
ncbi:ROK family protein [Rapidithrix thailandica]|uniref:ROK family protein n=1 Tax=Rapidithrix thailandica TaxID=413964 RepID=A0AAW9S4F8_9BACT